jgi:exosortase C (VPDSG-CTERM-specific)
MTGPSSPSQAATPQDNFRGLIITAALLLAGFCLPLVELTRFALGSELYSHAILIPFVSAWLVWQRRAELVTAGKRLHPLWALGLMVIGLVFLFAWLTAAGPDHPTGQQDALTLSTYALIFIFAGACSLFLNRSTMRAIAFPLGLLVFMAPFPHAVEAGLETLLQHGSAAVADVMFRIIGTPLFREGTVFHLPGFTMQVAPECSGIHSTLALFITSLVAGALLLRNPGSRATLALVVLPIALLRNGLRVTTIGELCVRISPDMIHSFIHTRGGPIFFVISLVPFSLILLLLLKWERRLSSSPRSNPSNS